MAWRKTLYPQSPTEILPVLKETQPPWKGEACWVIEEGFDGYVDGVRERNFFFETTQRLEGSQGKLRKGIRGVGQLSAVGDFELYGLLRLGVKGGNTTLSFQIENGTQVNELDMVATGLFKYLEGYYSDEQTQQINNYLDEEVQNQQRQTHQLIHGIHDLLPRLSKGEN